MTINKWKQPTLSAPYFFFNPFQNKPWFLLVCSTSLLKTLWDKEKLLVTSNFSFAHSVFYPIRELSSIFYQIWNCRLQTLSIWKSLKFVVWERVKEDNNGSVNPSTTQFRQSTLYQTMKCSMGLNWKHIADDKINVTQRFNPFPNKPWFLPVCSTSLLKTMWEKEKLLITSNFSFSHSVFYLLRELSAIFYKFEIVVCKLFAFWKA